MTETPETEMTDPTQTEPGQAPAPKMTAQGRIHSAFATFISNCGGTKGLEPALNKELVATPEQAVRGAEVLKAFCGSGKKAATLGWAVAARNADLDWRPGGVDTESLIETGKKLVNAIHAPLSESRAGDPTEYSAAAQSTNRKLSAHMQVIAHGIDHGLRTGKLDAERASSLHDYMEHAIFTPEKSLEHAKLYEEVTMQARRQAVETPNLKELLNGLYDTKSVEVSPLSMLARPADKKAVTRQTGLCFTDKQKLYMQVGDKLVAHNLKDLNQVPEQKSVQEIGYEYGRGQVRSPLQTRDGPAFGKRIA